ncbi:MAG TPA: ABC transporter permease subunit [Thermoleophilaceae bacterium]|nr:ABC transporter permease subunit [Thermoleophilaceae bacterium]
MSALLRRGLLDRHRALIVWALSIGLTGAFFMLVWPSIDDSISQALDSYPESVKEAFGITTLSNAEQYLNAELFSFILPFALAIFALRTVASAIDGAQERGHLDVLLSAPVSRRRLVAATFAAVAIELAIILLASWALTCLGSLVAGADLDAGLAAAGYANVWPLAIFAAGIAMLVTGVSQHAGAVTGVAAGAIVAMYVLDLLGRLSDSIEPFRWLSAFRYYGTAAVDGIDPLAFAGLTAAGLLLAAIGALLFERRDLAG